MQPNTRKLSGQTNFLVINLWCPNIWWPTVYTYVRGCTDTVGQTVKLTTWLWAHVCSPPVCTALRARVRFLLAELRLISFRLYVSPLSIVHHGWISNSPIARSFYRRIFRYSPTVGRPARVQLSCSFANLRKGFTSDRFRTIILA